MDVLEDLFISVEALGDNRLLYTAISRARRISQIQLASSDPPVPSPGRTLGLQKTEPPELAAAHLFALRMKLTTFYLQPARASCSATVFSFSASVTYVSTSRDSSKNKKTCWKSLEDAIGAFDRAASDGAAARRVIVRGLSIVPCRARTVLSRESFAYHPPRPCQLPSLPIPT